jgi:stage II sporulation protein D
VVCVSLIGSLLGPTTVSASIIPFHQTSRIRVRLSEGASVARIHGMDLKFYQKSHLGTSANASSLALSASRQSDWELHCQDGRVRAQKINSDAEGQIGEQTLELQEPVTIRSASGFISYGGKPYREELQIHSAGSLCEVVNTVDLEKYLEGLVNAEFNSRWNEEAIGAQVVAARTYALYQIRQASAEDMHYDVDASTSDQVYDGSIREDERAARVVGRTRGLVLTVGVGGARVPLKAYYSSTCGGATELPEKVWGSASAGFHHGVKCPFCAYSPAAHWNLDLSGDVIVKALRRTTRNEGALQGWSASSKWSRLLEGRVTGLRVGGLDSSGRVNEVFISFYNSGSKTGLREKGAPMSGELAITGPKFREIMGSAKFRSAAFEIAMEGPGTWHFQGRGNGHGVGMCQWGAKTMGEKGYKTASILKFYYPDATLQKLW